MNRRFRKPQSAERPSKEALDGKLKRSGISLNPAQLDQLWRYHNLLGSRNQDRELTRLIGFDTIVTKHYIDCLIVGDHLRLPSPLLDIGTGAGFPGIPLKIRYHNLHLILGEPRPKRVAFLKEAGTMLKFRNWEVFDHKVVSRSFQRSVPGIITRAVETIDKTCLRTSACLGEGGLLIFMKGPGVDPELKEVQKRFPGEFRVKLDKAYRLPHTPFDRRLVVLEKLVPAKLPDGAAALESEDAAAEAEDSDL